MKSKQNMQSGIQKPEIPSLKEKLQQAQMSLKDWSEVASSPDLSPRAASAARSMVRSLRAAVKVGQASLQAFPDQNNPDSESTNLPPTNQKDLNDQPEILTRPETSLSQTSK